MLKTLKIFLLVFCGIVFLLTFTGQSQAATVTFNADTQLDLTGASPTLYINTGSECDSLVISTSTVNVDVPAGSTFTLETATYTVLGLTPAGGTTTLAFDTTYYGTYVTQWIASSSVSTATTSFSVGGKAGNYYTVSVDGSELGSYLANDSGVVSFNYTGGYSAKTFTISQEDPSSSGLGSDVTPPVISGIEVITGETQATVSWKTNESSISWIVYGTSDNYGLEIKTTATALSHSLTLTGLVSETTYHYQIKSEDNYKNLSFSEDKVFTTLALGEEEEEEVPISKPISEMTIKELKSEIARISVLISQLQVQLVEFGEIPTYEGIPSGFTFQSNLKFGAINEDVRYLQIILNSVSDTKLAESGVGSPGHETNYFGPLTKAAVIKFQEKYIEDILTPWELTKGTGFVGKTTRTKLNEL